MDFKIIVQHPNDYDMTKGFEENVNMKFWHTFQIKILLPTQCVELEIVPIYYTRLFKWSLQNDKIPKEYHNDCNMMLDYMLRLKTAIGNRYDTLLYIAKGDISNVTNEMIQEIIKYFESRFEIKIGSLIYKPNKVNQHVLEGLSKIYFRRMPKTNMFFNRVYKEWLCPNCKKNLIIVHRYQDVKCECGVTLTYKVNGVFVKE